MKKEYLKSSSKRYKRIHEIQAESSLINSSLSLRHSSSTSQYSQE